MTDTLHTLQIGEDQRLAPRARAPRAGRQLVWIAGLAAVAAALAAVAWARNERARPAAVAPAPAPAEPPAAAALTAGGYVRHARIVHVVPRLSGVITSLRVAEGDLVHAGELLATLDSREAADQVAEARADVDARDLAAERAHRERERARVLADEGVLAVQSFEQADTESRVSAKAAVAARARLARTRELLERTRVRAPIAGRVLRKFLDVGSVVSFGLPYAEGYSTLAAGSPIVAIGQLEALEATADVNQADLARVPVGGRVEVRADAFPDRSWPARVLRLSPRADRNKNTVEVTVRFDEPAPTELAQDMSVKLTFAPPPQPESTQHQPAAPPAVRAALGGNHD